MIADAACLGMAIYRGIALVVPIRIEPERNLRQLPVQVRKRAREQKRVVTLALDAFFGPRVRALLGSAQTIEVRITRRFRAPSRMYDDDNFVAGCKALRDAIAKWLGVDDGDARLRWHYGQLVADQHPREAIEIRIAMA